MIIEICYHRITNLLDSRLSYIPKVFPQILWEYTKYDKIPKYVRTICYFSSKTLKVELPGQSCKLHSLVSVLSPTQSVPPFSGAGSVQVLVLV